MRWRLGVVGSPIAHSLSPQLHEAALRLCGLDGASERWEVTEHEANLLRSAMGSRFDALSVTMPLKERALELCDDVDAVAQRIGAVNSLVWREGRIMGTNTDGRGLLAAIGHEFGWSADGAHVVVLGTGGAAKSIVDACVEAGSASVSVHGRNEAAVASLREKYDRVRDEAVVYRPIDLIVNTVPTSGRTPTADTLNGVTVDTVAVDVTYDTGRSAWLGTHAALGCRTQDGMPMLAHQAALQASWWWGIPVDGARLLEAL